MSLAALQALPKAIKALKEAAAEAGACNVLVPAIAGSLASSTPAVQAAARSALSTLHSMADGTAFYPAVVGIAIHGGGRSRLPLVHALADLVESAKPPPRRQVLKRQLLPVRSSEARRPPCVHHVLITCALPYAKTCPSAWRSLRRNSRARRRRTPATLVGVWQKPCSCRSPRQPRWRRRLHNTAALRRIRSHLGRRSSDRSSQRNSTRKQFPNYFRRPRSLLDRLQRFPSLRQLMTA